MDVTDQGIGITTERVFLKINGDVEEPPRELFPLLREAPKTILSRKGVSKKRQAIIVSKEQGGNENFYPETPKQAFLRIQATTRSACQSAGR